MTGEKAEKIRKGIEDKIRCNTVDMEEWAEYWGFTEDEYDDFLDMAVETSEKEPKWIPVAYKTTNIKLMALIDLVQAWIDRQEADGCEGCAFVKVEEWKMPCERCRRNCKDYYRRAEQ